jgi:hypothetical protein
MGSRLPDTGQNQESRIKNPFQRPLRIPKKPLILHSCFLGKTKNRQINRLMRLVLVHIESDFGRGDTQAANEDRL